MLLTSGQMCEICGIGHQMLIRLVAAGVITPALRGRGKGRHHAFGPVNLSALGAYVSMTQAGCPVAQAVAAAMWIQKVGWDALKEQINNGKTFLVVFGEEVIDPLLCEDRASEVGDILQKAKNRPLSIAITNLEKPFAMVCELEKREEVLA